MSLSPWWRGAVIYQIYPRSFLDINGDGFGDLPGIIERLDYVASLGVDAIWIAPFFKSPMHDFGYDVSDYRSVDPLFGSMQGWRKSHPAIERGDLQFVSPNDTILAFTRSSNDERIFLAFNLSSDSSSVSLPSGRWSQLKVPGLLNGTLHREHIFLPGYGVVFASHQ